MSEEVNNERVAPGVSSKGRELAQEALDAHGNVSSYRNGEGQWESACTCGFKYDRSEALASMEEQQEDHRAEALALLLAETWDTAHMLGELLAYNALFLAVWEKDRTVVPHAAYRAARASRVKTMPHWDSNPYRGSEDGD